MKQTMITQVRKDLKRHNGQAKVYVDCPAIDNKIDKWFNDNAIRSMTVKSRGWAVLTRARNQAIAAHIKTALGAPDAVVNFSHKCGCGCGCSPGFNVKWGSKTPSTVIDKFINGDAWIDVVPFASQLAAVDLAIKKADIVHKKQIKAI